MDKRIIFTAICSTLGLINASGLALADPVSRYECSIVGAVGQDPVGDKDGHQLHTVQYFCLGMEGLVKGAIYTGMSVSEWNGSQGTYLSGGGTVRTTGGLAVSQITEGVGSVVMKDGKPVGSQSSGKSQIKFASGTLSALGGKAYKWETKPAGFGRFSLEVTTEEEVSTTGASKQ